MASKLSNDARAHKELIFSLIRQIASSNSEDEFQNNVAALTESYLWKNPAMVKFRNWFENKWLSVKEVIKS